MASEEDYVTIRNAIPRLWWNMYQGSLQYGFTPEQAFQLLQTYILAQNPNGIRPPDGHGPSSDDPER